MPGNFSILVIGATGSTLQILKGLKRNGANVVGAFALDSSASANVSGFATPAIEAFCKENRVTFQKFVNVNDSDTISAISKKSPDIVFAVGFSQILGEEALSIARLCNVGFHPTFLPNGRGRAPLAWLTYDVSKGAASFFVMKDGMDNGPILVQEPFEVEPDDHASDVSKKIRSAIDRALDRWVPELVKGEIYAKPQDESLASYSGIRRPGDGLIDWEEPWEIIYSTIRASSRPHPGAYTFADDRKILIWKAVPASDMPWRGVPGRVLTICEQRGVLVQAGDGLLWLKEIEDAESNMVPIRLKIGQRLGYVPQT